MPAKLKDKLINRYGQALLDSTDLLELILQGKNIEYFHVTPEDEDIQRFRKYQRDLLPAQLVLLDPPPEDMTFDEFHRRSSETWTFPAEYQSIDVKEWLLLKCSTSEQRDRVLMEYQLFESRDMIMPLRLFIFLVDYMRQNGFIWGVGRGSAVSSYILYLIGIHRVDSLKYSLDIKEFLR